MSIKKRLAEKSAGLSEGLEALAGVSNRVPKTGPGQLLAVRSHLRESEEKTSELEERVKAFEGAHPTRLLDPKRVVASKWSNRHALNFSGAEFEAFKAEVQSAGGNVQPIKVRPIKGRLDVDYEIVFGHRRHRACLELGIEVSAVVEPMEDDALFLAMDRENRQRADLSPWEQGMSYRRALDEGLFSSLRQLASRVGADPGNVSKALSLARLPDEVVGAFPSPLALQFRWAAPLSEAIQRDAEGVLGRARIIAMESPRPVAGEVLRRLLGKGRPSSSMREVLVDSKRIATIREHGGRVRVEFEKGVMSGGMLDRLEDSIRVLIAK